MKTKSEEIKQIELAFGVLICSAASGYQAFKPGCHTIGRGETPEMAAQNWKAQRLPYSGPNDRYGE